MSQGIVGLPLLQGIVGVPLAPGYCESVLAPGYCGVHSGISLGEKKEKMSFATTMMYTEDITSNARRQKYFTASVT